MNTIETTTRRMIKQAETYWPMNGVDAARFFDSHDKCADVYGLDAGRTGVVERNDGDTLVLWLEVDGETVESWEYTAYAAGMMFEDVTATGGSVGDWATIAGDIAKTVTEWLEDSPVPAPVVVEIDTKALTGRLITIFKHVGLEKDEDGTYYVVVYLGEDSENTAEVRFDYVNTGFSVEYVDGYGDSTEALYPDLDSLFSGLEEHGAEARA